AGELEEGRHRGRAQDEGVRRVHLHRVLRQVRQDGHGALRTVDGSRQLSLPLLHAGATAQRLRGERSQARGHDQAATPHLQRGQAPRDHLRHPALHLEPRVRPLRSLGERGGGVGTVREEPGREHRPRQWRAYHGQVARQVKLEGKVALITGAGSGIGRAVAQLFAQEGARVVANDLHAPAAKETVESLGARADAARAIQADVADSGQVKAMFAEVEREMGSLDVLVHNACIAGTSAAGRERLLQKSDARIMEMVSGQGVVTHWDITQDMTDEAWFSMIGVHLNGTFFCTREALRLMSRQNRGAIVNMSSVAGSWASRTCRTTAQPRRASW